MHFTSVAKNTLVSEKNLDNFNILSSFCWLVMAWNNRLLSSYLLILNFIRWGLDLTSRLVEYRLRDIKDILALILMISSLSGQRGSYSFFVIKFTYINNAIYYDKIYYMFHIGVLFEKERKGKKEKKICNDIFYFHF